MFWNKRIERLESWFWNLDNYTKRDQYQRLNELDKKLNLILDHLNLQYIPETEKKEPAKLVEKNSNFFEDLKHGSVVRTGLEGDFLGIEMYKPTEPIFKPKRKYTRRKKAGVTLHKKFGKMKNK